MQNKNDRRCNCYVFETGLVRVGWSFGMNNDDFYFEEEEPFKITEAGLYKTRDGRKVFISHIKEGCCTGLIECYNNSSQWQDDGKFLAIGSCQIDIVSKWRIKR